MCVCVYVLVCVCVWVGTGGTDKSCWEGRRRNVCLCSKKRRGRSHWVHSPIRPLSSSLNNIPLPKSSCPPTLSSLRFYLNRMFRTENVCMRSPYMHLQDCSQTRKCVYVHGYTWLLIWAVSDSTVLPGRSQSFSPMCLPIQAVDWPSPSRNRHTHTHLTVMVHRSHDLTAFPFLSVRLILLLCFFHPVPTRPFRCILPLTPVAIKTQSSLSAR